MRILLITPYPPTRDGIGTYAQSLRAELEAQGHETRVVAARADAPALAETIGAVQARRGPAEQRLLEAIDAFSPEVVHVQFAIAGYAASVFGVMRLMAALKRRGHPIVTTMHEVTRDTNSLRGIGRAMYRAVSARTDLAILHTAGAAGCLTELLKGRRLPQLVIPHPRASLPDADTSVEELRHQFGLAGKRVILSFGFIDIDKGIQDLIRAVALLRRDARFSDVTLVIAGTVRGRFGPFRIFELRDRVYLAYLQRTIRRTGLSPAVVEAGYVPSGAMRSWFELADVAALAYRRCEASGVANIASAAGTTVVATAVGELVSLSAVPDLAPCDASALAAALARLLNGEVPVTAGTSGEGVDFSEIATRTVAGYAELAGPQRITS